jgi:large subunit ribosomal protein L22
MEFVAKARYVSYSPYKLRPVVDIMRGKNAAYALGWLMTYKTQRATPVLKLLQSALANAKHLKNLDPKLLKISTVCVDQGPIRRYFKPGDRGRAMPQRKRYCHMSIVLQAINETK